MKYFKAVMVLIVCPTLATLLVQWLKTVGWLKSAVPYLDFLTGAAPIPRVAVFVIVAGLVCLVLIDLLNALEAGSGAGSPAPRKTPAPDGRRNPRLDYLRNGPATVFGGSGPAPVPLSRAEELVMIEMAHADPQPLGTTGLHDRIGEPAMATEHAADLLLARQLATDDVVAGQRLLHFTPQGRAVAVQRGYDKTRPAGDQADAASGP